MRVPRLIISVAALCCLCRLGLGQGQYRIAGTVVQHKTGQPMRRVAVTVRPVENRGEAVSAVTGSDGRFEFTQVPKGKYALEAEVNGIIQLFHSNDEFSTAVATGPGLDSEHLVFPFTKTASLRVSVADEEGDPVPSAQVFLFARRVIEGWPQIRMEQHPVISSGGTMRLTSLTPGTYLVAVQGQPWYAQTGPTNSQGPTNQAPDNQGGAANNDDQSNSGQPRLDVAFATTYYNDALTPEGATPVTLEEGGSTEIRVSMHAVPTAHLESAMGVNLMMYGIGAGGMLIPVQTSGYSSDGTKNTFAGFASGRYFLSLQDVPRQRPGRPFTNESKGTGVAEIGESTELKDVVLSRTELSGSIQIEGDGQPGPLGFQNIENGDVDWATATPDGKFSVGEGQIILPGKYRIGFGNRGDVYIRSIVAKGAAITDGLMEVAQGASISLAIKAAHGSTKVDGAAAKDGKPFGGAMILLVPRDSNFPHAIARDQSDSDGTFTLPNVRPGKYTLLAIDDGTDLAYQDLNVLKPYLVNGQAIEIAPGRLPAAVHVEVTERR